MRILPAFDLSVPVESSVRVRAVSFSALYPLAVSNAESERDGVRLLSHVLSLLFVCDCPRRTSDPFYASAEAQFKTSFECRISDPVPSCVSQADAGIAQGTYAHIALDGHTWVCDRCDAPGVR